MSNVTCKLLIENIYMDVYKVQVNKYCMSGHKAALEIFNGMYPMQKTVIIAKELAGGSRGQSWEDIFQGYVPSKMVIGMLIQMHFLETTIKINYIFNILTLILWVLQ